MAPDEAPAADPSTGVEEVDAVLTALERLDDLPVADHVAVFEQAHAALRQALDGIPGAVSEQARG